MNSQKNIFCDISSLSNESDVEQFFVIRLLQYLGYSDNQIKTKTSLDEFLIGKGAKNEKYKPDYVCFVNNKPKIVIDAKSPQENINNYVYQVSGYALALNKKFRNENPVRYTVLTNGVAFALYNWDEEEPILICNFEDFNENSVLFKKLISLLDVKHVKHLAGNVDFSLQNFLSKPTVEEVKSSFNRCHNIIWKKEKISPTDAFYEFSKIIFVKLSEDARIHRLKNENKELRRTDFKFSTDWLEEREIETENPLSSILFKDIYDKLQEEIDKNKKKQIFLEGQIELKAPTIKEVVRVLQNYDLYAIDEDLNGRMFETFLNATIRGKELGQYFTPRKVVKFMTKLANLRIVRENDKNKIDRVLDACCGSGGFLIDAMADLTSKVELNNSLIPYKNELFTQIKTEALWGIEANPKISRVARINMYAHGDGGSRIYCADSLDKNISITKGTNPIIKKELEELKKLLVEEGVEFDVVLTNPPFSMSYSQKDKDEKEVLLQYANSDYTQNLTLKSGTTELKSSVKSNVLFIARYNSLLRKGGKLLIILDNSVLNSYSHKEYRDYIRNNFIIKAIFQLPTHTFVNQEAGGITSILYLEKRISAVQEQPPVFAREIENVGHSTSGKELSVDDFDNVLKEYKRYELEGKLYFKGEKPLKDYEHDLLFLVPAEKIPDRLDVFFHQPSYHNLLSKLRSLSSKGKCEIKTLSDFEKIPNIDTEETDDSDAIYKYIDISTIDKERGFIMEDDCDEGTREQLPDRAKLLVRQNDIIFSKPFRSLKKVAIIPLSLDKQLASSGFYGIRPSNREEACILWSIFKSNLIQVQLLHLSSGYTQRELNEEYLKEYLLIPITNKKDELARAIENSISEATDARQEELKAIRNIISEPEKSIEYIN
ncbi:MAG: N-6 DNA methylase [Patescibacteria group bacterium]|jgi:type I restriction enzyme M protein